MILVDTHTHLYVDEFDADKEQVVLRAIQNGVNSLLLPSIDSAEFPKLSALAKQFPTHCFPMMGLHPCYVKENWQVELAFVEQQLAAQPYIAIGEIGLDLYWDTSFYSQQVQVFTRQLQLAVQYKLPVSIHSRQATQQAIDIVKPFAQQGVTGVFHCFGESVEIANQIITMGFKLGIGGVVTYKKSGLQEVLQQIGIQHIVLETDSPYLSPVPYRGKRNESSYLLHIAETIAHCTDTDIQNVAAISTQNAMAIFNINAWQNEK